MSGIVAIIVLVCYRKEAHEGIWRICFGIGVIVSVLLRSHRSAHAHDSKQLPVAVFIFCFRMINSTQYRKHAIKSNVPYREALKWYWKPLLGSSSSPVCIGRYESADQLSTYVVLLRLHPISSRTLFSSDHRRVQSGGYDSGEYRLWSQLFTTQELHDMELTRSRRLSILFTFQAQSSAASLWTRSVAVRP